MHRHTAYMWRTFKCTHTPAYCLLYNFHVTFEYPLRLFSSISITNMVLISVAYVTRVWYRPTQLLEEGQQVPCHSCPLRRPLWPYRPCTCFSLCSRRLRGSDLPWRSEHRPPRVLLTSRNTSSHDAYLRLPPRNSGVHAGSGVPAFLAYLQHSRHELHSRGGGARNTQAPPSPQGHLQPGYSPADHWYGLEHVCFAFSPVILPFPGTLLHLTQYFIATWCWSRSNENLKLSSP